MEAGTVFNLRQDSGMLNMPAADILLTAFEAPNANGWFGATTADGNEWHIHTELVGDVFENVATTWAGVRAGDVAFQGMVAKVSEPRASRSGRSLMTVTFTNGQSSVKDPSMECNVKRPV